MKTNYINRTEVVTSRSKIVKDGEIYRIKRFGDGKLVGAFETKNLAAKSLCESPYLR